MERERVRGKERWRRRERGWERESRDGKTERQIDI
jgi:hypothetical protein